MNNITCFCGTRLDSRDVVRDRIKCWKCGANNGAVTVVPTAVAPATKEWYQNAKFHSWREDEGLE